MHIVPHPNFRLKDHDFETEVPITPWEAALGGKTKVPTLKGEVTIELPAGLQSGQKMRLRGKGFPKPAGICGDLFVVLKIMVPKKLSPKERELFQKLAQYSAFQPRQKKAKGQKTHGKETI